jgi:hypothetical protein
MIAHPLYIQEIAPAAASDYIPLSTVEKSSDDLPPGLSLNQSQSAADEVSAVERRMVVKHCRVNGGKDQQRCTAIRLSYLDDCDCRIYRSQSRTAG